MMRQRFFGQRAAVFFAGLSLALLFSVNAFAQSGTSVIRGNVVDAQGAAVAGATVTITNDATSFTRSQATGDDGAYSFTAIPPGTYRVDAEAGGFKKSSLTEVRAVVDTPTDLNVTMETGDVSETVTVTSQDADALVNTQDATLGNNFNSYQIEQLPLESRNVASLLTLQPGVTRAGYVTGARSDQSNITLDGVDVNEQQTGDITAPVLRLTSESVQEFRVTTANANATQGRSSGAQVSLVTKSGSNEFHGALYHFHRNTVFTANNFFNNRAGRFVASDPLVQLGQAQAGDERVPRPTLIRNLFGGRIGGPIIKDRAFFFYTYEGRRDAAQRSVVRTVPLASLGRGEVRFLNSGGGITALSASQIGSIFSSTTFNPGVTGTVAVNPAALAVLADAARRYPANDFDVTGDSRFDRQLNTAGYRFNANVPVRLNTHIARFDFNLTNAQSIFVRGNYQHDLETFASEFPDTPSPYEWRHPYGYVVSHNWNLSSNLVNNFNYGLTRQAFTSTGDSNENSISFRFVFSPRAFTRTLSRVTPVHNITDNMTYLAGNHTLQFGTNMRFIRNRRVDYGASYDSAITNPTFYAGSGRVLDRPVTAAGFTVPSGSRSSVQNAVTAVLGRFSQYTARYNYNLDGSVQAPGVPLEREFATEEYDFYLQDVWKVSESLSLTYGLRYGLSRPVYETNGFQAVPDVPLGEFFERRVAGARAGRPVNDLIQFQLGGPSYDRPGFYPLDKNNFQPRVAVAWSPNYREGFLGKLFGADGASVVRGGFAITNDYFGQQLAVTFNRLSTLGFSTSNTVAANTFNVSSGLAPQFTAFGQAVRNFPNLVAPNRFQTPADEAERIESSLDATAVSPINYSWNASYGRKLPGGLFVEASYVGRAARNLLATRDIMALNNLVDPRSGVDWYTAAGQIYDLRQRNTPIANVGRIPYFENLFPGIGDAIYGDPSLSATQTVYQLVARSAVGGDDTLDWTYIQSNDLLDDLSSVGPNAFFHPQYAALTAFSTIARSNYHGGTLSVRQRLGNSLNFDFNYTLSKSLDDASGLQNADTYGAALILNPLYPQYSYGESDFDVRHNINANSIWSLPVGRGRKFFRDLPGAVDAVLGGWQLSGITRWNSGLPAPMPFDQAQWATNWNAQSNGVRTRPITSSPTRGGLTAPNLFSDPVAAFRSFRNARAGEAGDRNVLRLPGYFTLDMGLYKSFTMPWNENHQLQFRWDVFNVTNTQSLDIENVTRQSFGLSQDPDLNSPAETFGNFDIIQGSPRVMQFALRFTF